MINNGVMIQKKNLIELLYFMNEKVNNEVINKYSEKNKDILFKVFRPAVKIS